MSLKYMYLLALFCCFIAAFVEPGNAHDTTVLGEYDDHLSYSTLASLLTARLRNMENRMDLDLRLMKNELRREIRRNFHRRYGRTGLADSSEESEERTDIGTEIQSLRAAMEQFEQDFEAFKTEIRGMYGDCFSNQTAMFQSLSRNVSGTAESLEYLEENVRRVDQKLTTLLAFISSRMNAPTPPPPTPTTRPRVGGHGDPCYTDGDCSLSSSSFGKSSHYLACVNYTCQCEPYYNLVPDLGVCVAHCEQLGETFTGYPRIYLFEHNIERFEDTTLRSCQDHCLDDSNCVSADWGVADKTCHTSAFTLLEYPNLKRYHRTNAYYLQRNCA